jgi:hypothetical protein
MPKRSVALGQSKAHDKMNRQVSTLGGIVSALLCVAVLLLIAAMLLLSGHSALQDGQATAFFVKKGTTVLLRPEENPGWFYFEVWLRLGLGATLLVVCMAVPIRLARMSPARRAERWRASQAGLRPSPKVPWPIVGLVFVGYLAFLVYVAGA